MDSDGSMCFIPPNREKGDVNQEIHGDTRGYSRDDSGELFFSSKLFKIGWSNWRDRYVKTALDNAIDMT